MPVIRNPQLRTGSMSASDVRAGSNVLGALRYTGFTKMVLRMKVVYSVISRQLEKL